MFSRNNTVRRFIIILVSFILNHLKTLMIHDVYAMILKNVPIANWQPTDGDHY